MGRTSRQRKKRQDRVTTCLDSIQQTIELRKWMTKQGWRNPTRLKLSNFENSGRGVTSSKNISKSDLLIEVPYELMITYQTLQEYFSINQLLSDFLTELRIHDALSIFLVAERHKGDASKWKPYLDSLPKDNPSLPWLCFEDEIACIPLDFRLKVQDKLDLFKSSWQRSKKSINPLWVCEHCKSLGDRVFSLDLYTWAYIMVNTRAVYVNPNTVLELSRSSVNKSKLALSDDPCMALCPYLDMFNHSCKSATNAELVKVNNKWIYRLITLTPSEKFKEIFISYGSHDNDKLFCEYGFFIAGNELDILRVDFCELLKLINSSVSDSQYKFIKHRQLDQDLYVHFNGLSFNLKAVLFVITNSNLKDWCFKIFNESYNKEDLLQMHPIIIRLIALKIEKCVSELSSLKNYCKNTSNSFKTIFSYFNYKIEFMNVLLNNLENLMK